MPRIPAVRLTALALVLIALGQASAGTVAPTDPVPMFWCGSEFDEDVFLDGWVRTQPSILVEDGKLVIPSEGGYDDLAGMPCMLDGSFEVHVRARIVSGGNNYVFPFLEFQGTWQALGSEAIDVNVLPDNGATCPTGPALWGWLINDWSRNMPHKVACEGQWMTMRVVVDDGVISAGARLSDSEPFLEGHRIEATPPPLSAIRLRQPWNAHVEIDYIRVFAASDLPTIVREEASSTRGFVRDESDRVIETLRSDGSSVVSEVNTHTTSQVTAEAERVLAGVNEHVTAEHRATRAQGDSLWDWLRGQLVAIHTRFDVVDVSLTDAHEKLDEAADAHGRMHDKLDDIGDAIGADADTAPLSISVTSGTSPGSWYALVALRGAPTDADVTIEAADGGSVNASRMAPGLYAFDASALAPSLAERVLVLSARNGTHVGSAFVVVPPGVGSNAAAALPGADSAQPGATVETVFFERVIVVQNTTLALEGQDVPLARVTGAGTDDGRYRLDVAIGSEAPTSLTLPRGEGVPHIDQQLLQTHPTTLASVPGASLLVRVSYRAEERPLDANATAWLAGSGPSGAALVVRAEVRDGDGALIEGREVEIPVAGQALAWARALAPQVAVG